MIFIITQCTSLQHEVICFTIGNSSNFRIVTIRLSSSLESISSTSLTLVIIQLAVIIASSYLTMRFSTSTRNQELETTVDTIVVFVIVLTISDRSGNWVASKFVL